MFSVYHVIWMILCAAIIAVSLVLLRKYKPSLRFVLTVACVVCLISELIKIFSSIELVPSADGSMFYPYMKPQHLPLHLCSLQILTILYARFFGNERRKEYLLAFMYPTCIAGAAFAIVLVSIFPNSVPTEEAFTHPLAYQYFLYHTMLVILGLYILLSGEVKLRPKHCLSSLGILLGIGILSLYVNSMFSDAIFEADTLLSVEYTPNFFFTYAPPIDIPLTELWHWYVYLGVIATLATVLIVTFYIPVFLRAKKESNR